MQPTRTAPLKIPGTLIIIDNGRARDIDDAIAVERLPEGGYRGVVCAKATVFGGVADDFIAEARTKQADKAAADSRALAS